MRITLTPLHENRELKRHECTEYEYVFVHFALMWRIFETLAPPHTYGCWLCDAHKKSKWRKREDKTVKLKHQKQIFVFFVRMKKQKKIHHHDERRERLNRFFRYTLVYRLTHAIMLNEQLLSNQKWKHVEWHSFLLYIHHFYLLSQTYSHTITDRLCQ